MEGGRAVNKRFIALFLLMGCLLAGCAAEPEYAPVVATQPTSAASNPTTFPTQPTVPPEKPLVVCIDAGHQQSAIKDTEPIGPGAEEMKAKLSSGTQGVATNTPEYQLTLEVSLLLEQELLKRGYEVVMIRRTNDCPLSNAQRAQIANESGADIFVRIHANGSDDPSVSGMLCCAPTNKNPFLSGQLIDKSIRLSELIVQEFCTATGAQNKGLYYVDTMTGINWCQIPVTIVEMGFMSNPDEDAKMATAEYRAKMVTGMANGIDAYFEEVSQ